MPFDDEDEIDPEQPAADLAAGDENDAELALPDEDGDEIEDDDELDPKNLGSQGFGVEEDPETF
jgi:hypothetical protein